MGTGAQPGLNGCSMWHDIEQGHVDEASQGHARDPRLLQCQASAGPEVHGAILCSGDSYRANQMVMNANMWHQLEQRIPLHLATGVSEA
jgi:hypothetical protein